MIRIFVIALLLACSVSADVKPVSAKHIDPATARYDQVTWLCTHNAMNNSADGWKLPNQIDNIPTQLKNGVRALMLDVWMQDGAVVLRHGPPIARLLGSRPLRDGLAEIKKFLDSNPAAVVTIILESYVPSKQVCAEFTAAGLAQYCHTQPVGKPWPSLAAMRKSGKRLVVFSDRAKAADRAPSWYMPVWSHCWETNWEAKNNDELLSAQPRRGKRSNSLFILNHFVTNGTPSKRASLSANSDPFLTKRLTLARKQFKHKPNFLVLDFYSQGDALNAIKKLNP